MKRICIVPFTRQEYPLLDSLVSRYVITSLISPKGIGFEGEDVSILRNSSETGFCFTNSIEDGVNCSDVVLISDISLELKSLFEFAKRALLFALEAGKEVICCLNLEKSDIRNVDTICKRTGAVCHIPKPILDTDEYRYQKNTRLFSFRTPILYISELVPNCDGYDVFLKLAKTLQENGRNVLPISSECYNDLLDYVYVEWDSADRMEDQIFRINRLIYSLEQQHHPDIILLRLPKPLMRFSEAMPFDSGVTAYCISQAVPGDACVCCSLFNMFSEEFWKNFLSSAFSKFGLPILGIHISNRILDATIYTDSKLVCVPQYEVDTEIENHTNQTEITYLNLLNNSDIRRLYDELCERFFDFTCGVI